PGHLHGPPDHRIQHGRGLPDRGRDHHGDHLPSRQAR
ncbi:hypothetical protein BN1708_019297, partial [Verticillium longisporum]